MSMTSGSRKDTINAQVFAEQMESSHVIHPHSGSSQKEIMLCKIDKFQNPREIRFRTKRVETTHEGSQGPHQDVSLDNCWMWPGNLKDQDGDDGKKPGQTLGAHRDQVACEGRLKIHLCTEVSVSSNKSLILLGASISLASGQRQIRLKIRLKAPSGH